MDRRTQRRTARSPLDPARTPGAAGYSTTGRARIYRRPSNGSGYTGPVDVVPSMAGAGSDFGRAVAFSSFEGGWAAVGAPMHDFHGLVDAGAVFFYNFDAANHAWPQVSQVWGGDFAGDTADHRGSAVAMSQTSGFAAIGSPNHQGNGNPSDHGTVYVFKRVNGIVNMQPATINPPSPELTEHFGAAVAIERNTLVVGSPDEDLTLFEGGPVTAATDCGAIDIFERDPALFNTWNFAAKLRSPGPTASGHFGSKVATDGAQIVVGESATKKCYVFSKDGGTWHYQAAFGDTDAAATGSFASDVAVHAGDIAIADMLDDNYAVLNAGAVYVANVGATENIGDLCSNPLAIPSGDCTGCTTNATPSVSSANITSCGSSNTTNDVWFEFNPTCDGNAIFDTFGSSFDTVLSVHSSCPTILGGGNSITCNDDAFDTCDAGAGTNLSDITFTAAAGQSYLIRLGGYWSYSHGPASITIQPGSYCNDIDFNNDTLFPDTLDIDSFLSVFSGGACLRQDVTI